jgi:CheY-like chemotaxis protein
MEMGHFSGTDVLRKIRKENPDLPVFVITGHSDFNQEEARKCGFSGYIQKPVTMNTLAEFTGSSFKKTDKLSSLREMFDNDEEAIREIMDSFIQATNENLILLQQLINENKFQEAQAICHKMLPMFLQAGLDEEVYFLKKMDKLRDKDECHYPEWNTDGISFINDAKKTINDLKENL